MSGKIKNFSNLPVFKVWKRRLVSKVAGIVITTVHYFV